MLLESADGTQLLDYSSSILPSNLDARFYNAGMSLGALKFVTASNRDEPFSQWDSYIHSDFHPGNIFLNEENTKITIIDYGTTLTYGWSPLMDLERLSSGNFSYFVRPEEFSRFYTKLEQAHARHPENICSLLGNYASGIYPSEGKEFLQAFQDSALHKIDRSAQIFVWSTLGFAEILPPTHSQEVKLFITETCQSALSQVKKHLIVDHCTQWTAEEAEAHLKTLIPESWRQCARGQLEKFIPVSINKHSGE